MNRLNPRESDKEPMPRLNLSSRFIPEGDRVTTFNVAFRFLAAEIMVVKRRIWVGCE